MSDDLLFYLALLSFADALISGERSDYGILMVAIDAGMFIFSWALRWGPR